MSPREAEKLLGGWATGTLTEDERRALMRAAMNDQALFDALADEESLRDLLSDPAARKRLLDAVAPRRRPWLSWILRPVPVSAFAGGVFAILLVTAVRHAGVRSQYEAPQAGEVAAVQPKVERVVPSAPAPDPEAGGARRFRQEAQPGGRTLPRQGAGQPARNLDTGGPDQPAPPSRPTVIEPPPVVGTPAPQPDVPRVAEAASPVEVRARDTAQEPRMEAAASAAAPAPADRALRQQAAAAEAPPGKEGQRAESAVKRVAEAASSVEVRAGDTVRAPRTEAAATAGALPPADRALRPQAAAAAPPEREEKRTKSAVKAAEPPFRYVIERRQAGGSWVEFGSELAAGDEVRLRITARKTGFLMLRLEDGTTFSAQASPDRPVYLPAQGSLPSSAGERTLTLAFSTRPMAVPSGVIAGAIGTPRSRAFAPEASVVVRLVYR